MDPVTSMKPVAVNPSATFDQLLDGLEALENEKQQKNQVDQIIAKLQRKKRTMGQQTLEHFVDMSGGMTPDQVIDEIEHQTPEVSHEWLISHRELFQMLDASRPAGGRPVIVSDREDHLISHTRGYGNGERPEDYLDAFAEYVQKNRNEIAALNMICTRPKDLTRDSLRKLQLTLDREGFTVQQLNTALSELTNEEIAADIISLIRRYAIGSTLLGHEVRIRRAVDKLKKAHNFTRQELNWIGRMENYLLQESVLNVQVFDEDGRFKEQGGFTKINKVFQNKLESIVLELNEYLYDDGGKTA